MIGSSSKEPSPEKVQEWREMLDKLLEQKENLIKEVKN